MSHDHLPVRFFLGLFLVVAILAFLIFKPFIGVLVLAATFAVIFHPLYKFMFRVTGKKENIAALITTILILIIIVVPFTIFGIQIFQEAQSLYLEIVNPNSAFPLTPAPFVQATIHRFAPELEVDLGVYAKQALEWFLQHLGPAFSSVAKLFLNLFLSLLALFYLLRDGDKLIKKLISFSPLSDTYDHQILDRLQLAVNSVIRGSLSIAFIQGVLSGVGLALFNVPNAALWGSITVLAALIPNVGTAIVLVPAIGYLFFTTQIPQGVGLLIWGIVAVGLIDNILGPQLINRGIKIHPLIILLAVIGGLAFFGPIGYILGPLILALFFALLDIYPHFISKHT